MVIIAGGNYYVSAKQLCESERKIKALSLVQFSNFTPDEINSSLADQGSDEKNCVATVEETIAGVSGVETVTDMGDANATF
ncbi:MAG: hypothetical protein GY820_11145 [Gammaproteobacteria bacterium]|nr:hypothetical protein [Gammaproteobacteria bacterium]